MKNKTERICKLMEHFSKLQRDYPDTKLYVNTDKGHAWFRIIDVDLDMFAREEDHPYLVLDLGEDEGIDS